MLRSSFACLIAGAVLWAPFGREGACFAQAESGTPNAPEEPEDDRGPTISDSTVGYIDDALPGSQFRLRYDDAYRSNRPSRAEFVYAKGGPPGPTDRTKSSYVDFQELPAYLEVAVGPRVSAFVEAGPRFLVPNSRPYQAGIGDMDAGFKYAFWYTNDRVATFQFRTYVPTGAEDRGLGTGHVSLEPSLLVFQRVSDRVTLEAEFRDWIPVGGSDFAGNVARYGVGLSYGRRSQTSWWVTPVGELVGWTVLGGKEDVSDTPQVVKSAAGDTIVNAKVGLRVGLGDRGSLYAGYGRALTGDVWYKDVIRCELRIRF